MSLTTYAIGRNPLRKTLIYFGGSARSFLKPKMLNFSLRQGVKAGKKLLRQLGALFNRKGQGFATDCFDVHG